LREREGQNMSENIKELRITSEVFEDARNKFDGVLQKLFKTMLESRSDEGSITMKVDVSIKTTEIPDSRTGKNREINVPVFGCKVSSTVALKNKEEAISSPEMELIFDDESMSYKLTYISNTDQKTIWDDDLQEQEEKKTYKKPGVIDVGQIPSIEKRED
jgi:hypothetical protein